MIPVVGYALSLAGLVWVYHGFDWKSQLPALLRTDWRWVSLAVVTDISVYVLQGWRWSLLLSPLAHVSVLRSVQAIYIGLFANEILPFRTGEAIRAFLQSRWAGLPFSATASSVLLERFLDGCWLSLGFYLASTRAPVPRYLIAAAHVLAIVLAVVAGLVVLAALRKGVALPVTRRLPKFFLQIVHSLRCMTRSTSFAWATLVSLVYLALQVVPIYALFRGFGIELGFVPAAVVLVILRLGSIPPQAPSNVGAFQFFTVVALQLFGIPKSQAAAYATLLFVVVTVPLWVGGFFALLATRMRLGEIQAHAESQWNHLRTPSGVSRA